MHLSATGTRDVHRLLRSLVGRRYRAGDRVMITLTTPGYLAERVEIRIRSSRLPQVALLRQH